MKILALADLHGKIEGLQKILADANDYDVIVFVGDVTNFGPVETARQVVDELQKVGKKVFVLPGNCDPPEVLDYLEECGVSLHKKRADVDGILFFGVGGSNPTPFNTPFELSEEEIATTLDSVGGNGVMAVHAPPKNTKCDMLPGGEHAGSESVSGAIEKYSPDVVICGHIHEARGKDFVGSSLIVNPGEASRGYYAIIDTEMMNAELKQGGVGSEERKTDKEPDKE